MKVDMVQTSCGMGVPLFDYVQQRDQLTNWAGNKGEQGIKQYWQDNNEISLDGGPTGFMDKNT